MRIWPSSRGGRPAGRVSSLSKIWKIRASPAKIEWAIIKCIGTMQEARRAAERQVHRQKKSGSPPVGCRKTHHGWIRACGCPQW
jgi:hypothetical protein